MGKINRVLAVETSCDDTSVALVSGEGFVDAVCSANQDLQHKPFGGIVPEIACRNHTLNLLPLMDETFKKAGLGWSDVDGLAVTSRPGLVGSLLVGLVSIKTLALAKRLPFVGVNHLEGHLLAPFLCDDEFRAPSGFGFPYVGLAVSGGHTHLYLVEGLGVYRELGRTIDDAAGEAFDKFAKMLGLGYPGGVQVDRLSRQGDASAYDFPRPMIREQGFDFSFSGLKTAALRQIEQMTQQQRKARAADLCASYQRAIVDVLMARLKSAVKSTGIKTAVITGGVSANSELRTTALDWGKSEQVTVAIPPLRYCTDNAAMIGYAGLKRLQRGEVCNQSLSPSPRSYEQDFILSDR